MQKHVKRKHKKIGKAYRKVSANKLKKLARKRFKKYL